MGYTNAKAARMAGLAETTAHGIIHKHGHWGEVQNQPVFAELRRQQKAHLEAATRVVAAKALIQCDENIHKASAYQAAGIYGLLRTHERLDAGEPTEIVGMVADRRSVESIENLAAALGQALIARQESNAVSTLVSEAEVIGDLK